jgi:succinoglycan biosynthesis transport protein ExoP
VSESESTSNFGSYSALLRRRRVWILVVVPAAILAAVFVAFALPPQYRSTATLTLEQGTISEDLLKSTVRSQTNQQIDIIQGRVMTVGSIKELVKEFDPYPDQLQLNLEAKAQRVIEATSLERVDPVTFQPRLDSAAVALHYQNPNPESARIVATRLANLLLTYHQRARVEAARAAATLMEGRATELSKELRQVDEEFARLRGANGGALPDTKEYAEDARYRAERDLTDLEKQLRVAQQNESLLSIQLAGLSPNLLSSKGDLTDINTVRAQLADAQQRYTPDHPDVKRLKNALAVLMAQGAKSGSGPVANADNPEYRRVASELTSARVEISALQSSIGRARSQLAQYTAIINPSASLARQVADLDRRRQSLQMQYQQVQEKLKDAQLGQVAESGEHSEHFSMLQVPFAASQPYSPNRIGVILLGLVLGCGIAAAGVSIAESSDPTVRGARDFVGLNGLPILGTIPDMLLPSDLRRKRWIWSSVAVAFLFIAGLDVTMIMQSYIRAAQIVGAVSEEGAH